MSDKDRHLDLENHLNSRNEFLSNLYDAKSSEIPDAEKASLLPILTTLETSSERYQEVELIAKGGEKRITRVMDHRLNRHVAMARAVKAESRQDQEQFLREARLEANLAHPNIVPVYNMGIDPDGVPFFTMELIPGDSLKTVINKLRNDDKAYLERYPLSVLLSMFLKICDAIAYAHSRQVIHLDIKPDNIRVGEFGEVYVCDWGLARVLYTDIESLDTGTLDGDILNDMTQTGLLKGTPGFMAPEQTDTHGEKTVRTDIYALGALLYNMLTYQLPVAGNSGNELIENTRCGKVIPPHARGKSPAIPKGLAAVALKALALDPEDRYAGASEIQEEIVSYLSGFPTTAERADLTTTISLLIKRHNRISGLIMIFLIILAGVIATNLVIIQRGKSEAIAAKERAEENFRLYREQEMETKKLDSELSDSTQYAVRTKDYTKAREMIRVLEIALSKNPDDAERDVMLNQKGTMHFVLQQFNKASECFIHTAPENPVTADIKLLSQKYANIKPRDSKLLTLPQLTHLIREAKNITKPIYYLYNNYMYRAPEFSAEEHLPLAKALLDKLNKVYAPRSALILKKREKGYHLDLTQSPYLIYSLTGVGFESRNVLAPLNPYSMDISGLPLLSLSEFANLRLKELNMANLNIQGNNRLLIHLKRLPLERIIIDTAAYPKPFIKQLREKYEVIDVSTYTAPTNRAAKTRGSIAEVIPMTLLQDQDNQ